GRAVGPLVGRQGRLGPGAQDRHGRGRQGLRLGARLSASCRRRSRQCRLLVPPGGQARRNGRARRRMDVDRKRAACRSGVGWAKGVGTTFLDSKDSRAPCPPAGLIRVERSMVGTAHESHSCALNAVPTRCPPYGASSYLPASYTTLPPTIVISGLMS